MGYGRPMTVSTTHDAAGKRGAQLLVIINYSITQSFVFSRRKNVERVTRMILELE